MCNFLPNSKSLASLLLVGKIGSSREKSFNKPFSIRGLMNCFPFDADTLCVA